MTSEEDFLAQLRLQDAVWVTVQGHRGSVPREAGAWMAVFAQNQVGTIGGGHLEWQALREARHRLAGQSGEPAIRFALGPSLGQCWNLCGKQALPTRFICQKNAIQLRWLLPSKTTWCSGCPSGWASL